MAMYYNGKKVRNLYFNGKCITRLALGKEMTRLVEGDDFVRAEWLCWNGAAYIDTQIMPKSGDEISLDCYFPSQPPFRNVGLIGADGDTSVLYITTGGAWFNPEPFAQFLIVAKDKTTSSAYTAFGYQSTTDIRMKCNVTFSINNIPQAQLIIKNRLVTGNVVSDNYFTVVPNNSYVIGKYRNNIGFGTGKLKSVSINSIDFVPCRLLRPIPASLDANGIARNAGDCGMFDSISGKFYGNVASSGTFTVSDN